MSTINQSIKSFKSFDAVMPIMARQWTDSELMLLRDKYSEVPNKELVKEFDRTISSIKSKASAEGLSKNSRLVSRWKMLQSDKKPPKIGDFGNYIRGLTDGEGSFNYRTDSSGRMSFRYAIELVNDDKEILEKVMNFFGVGTIYNVESRSENWSGSDTYVVYSAIELGTVIIPFFVEYRPIAPTKRNQFKQFAEEFANYFELEPEMFKWVDRLDNIANNRK